ncbi:hypothetical protein GcM1_250169 [Golovinomyces cichoracearum]|uniref:Uncharacterized protein n=1 Tax=Golovinomyces cichoracearum TaxID=62708 RepID=A0A420IB47_9PEZI|nr:hypothetical protein GcM1_250169 [Golovinomyces cichoracearum]
MNSFHEEKELSSQTLDSSDQIVYTNNLPALPMIAETIERDIKPTYTENGLGQGIDTIDIQSPSNMGTEEIPAEESGEEESNLELPELEWGGLESKFTEALQQLDKKESQILDQFDQVMEIASSKLTLAQMFFIWAQTGFSHETDRAVKRLKTRERYVQISETSFEKKKEHYN